jgi:hypothetical protein
MTQRTALVTLIAIAVAVSLGSCIFQNDPVKPNTGPTLVSYYPPRTFITVVLPDTLRFGLHASDPDGDELRYRFVVGDSVLSASDSAVFYGIVEGEYAVIGSAFDDGAEITHTWNVTVAAEPNVAPVITGWDPEQGTIACVIGDTVSFEFWVEDDNYEAHRYSWFVDDEEVFTGYAELHHRFMENGQYTVRGTVWDGEYGDSVSWDVTVLGEPDTIPPAMIGDLVGETGDVPRTVRLLWTAPGDDGDTGRAASYIVRTSTFPILSEDDWTNAAGKLGEPVPSPAGTEEIMIVNNLNPGTFLYATVRAADDFFNLSPLGNCVRVLVRGADVEGYVIDLVSNEPVPRMYVSSNGVSTTSDDSGYYLLANLPYFRYFRARDEFATGYIGNYFDSEVLVTGFYDNYELNLYLIDNVALVNTVNVPAKYEDFLTFCKAMTETNGWAGRPTVDKTWNHYPLAVYNPPAVYTYGETEIDMQDEARVAMNEWETMTGLDLFVETDSRIAADLEIVYVDTLIDKHHVSTPAYNTDGTPAKKVLWIYPGNTSVPIIAKAHLILVHELGHVLCLSHSEDRGHVMLGGTLPFVENVTQDEANVVRVIYNAPSIFDYGTILKE